MMDFLQKAVSARMRLSWVIINVVSIYLTLTSLVTFVGLILSVVLFGFTIIIILSFLEKTNDMETEEGKRGTDHIAAINIAARAVQVNERIVACVEVKAGQELRPSIAASPSPFRGE